VADIFRAYGEAYRQRHALTPEQREVMWAIENCRTAVLGGHLDVCDACGYQRPSYNSCRNRHCPKCQSLAQAEWLEQRQQHILPTHYFHVVFTLPHELHPLFRKNQKLLYNLLFQAVSKTLLQFGRNRLQAQIGFTAVLHTWTRDLRYHPHLHCIVTGGGLALSDNGWVATSRRYLFPVKALAALFRGKFLSALQRAYDQNLLQLDGCDFADRVRFRRWKDKLYSKPWVVYSKRPFGGPREVFNYLGRYTHRVGLSNRRLVRLDEQGVCFTTKNGKTTTLAPERFIARFLLHVLPKGFVKIRHYGLMASSHLTTQLQRSRQLLELQQVSPQVGLGTEGQDPIPRKDWRDRFEELTGIDLAVCPRCQGRMRRHLFPVQCGLSPQLVSAPDSS
jgi:hypothetical protein